MVTNTSTRMTATMCMVATTTTISIASQYQHHAASQPWLPPPGILNVSTPPHFDLRRDVSQAIGTFFLYLFFFFLY